MSSANTHVTRTNNNDQLATALFSHGAAFVRRHPRVFSLYVVGLVVFNLFTGFAVDALSREKFDQSLRRIDLPKYENLRVQVSEAYQQYYDSKGWFFACDEFCTRNYNAYLRAEQELHEGEAEYKALLSQARAHVGIFSEFGVQDVKDKFWEAYYGGAGMAKRMSYFDALTMSLSAMRRDESFLSVVLNWLISAAINFSFAMITTLFAFAYHLASLIISYQANPISGLSFFLLAMVAAMSVIGSFVVGIYLATASTAYVAVKTLGRNMRIEFNEGNHNRARPQFIRADHRD